MRFILLIWLVIAMGQEGDSSPKFFLLQMQWAPYFIILLATLVLLAITVSGVSPTPLHSRGVNGDYAFDIFGSKQKLQQALKSQQNFSFKIST